MSKESAENKHLSRSPKAMMDFQVTGRRPNAVRPTSPLITYLESIPPHERARMQNVRLSPTLGYQSGMRFPNAEQMLRYLKPSQWVVGTWPAESYRIQGFRRPITDEMFQAAQTSP